MTGDKNSLSPLHVGEVFIVGYSRQAAATQTMRRMSEDEAAARRNLAWR